MPPTKKKKTDKEDDDQETHKQETHKQEKHKHETHKHETHRKDSQKQEKQKQETRKQETQKQETQKQETQKQETHEETKHHKELHFKEDESPETEENAHRKSKHLSRTSSTRFAPTSIDNKRRGSRDSGSSSSSHASVASTRGVSKHKRRGINKNDSCLLSPPLNEIRYRVWMFRNQPGKPDSLTVGERALMANMDEARPDEEYGTCPINIFDFLDKNLSKDFKGVQPDDMLRNDPCVTEAILRIVAENYPQDLDRVALALQCLKDNNITTRDIISFLIFALRGCAIFGSSAFDAILAFIARLGDLNDGFNNEKYGDLTGILNSVKRTMKSVRRCLKSFRVDSKDEFTEIDQMEVFNGLVEAYIEETLVYLDKLKEEDGDNTDVEDIIEILEICKRETFETRASVLGKLSLPMKEEDKEAESPLEEIKEETDDEEQDDEEKEEKPRKKKKRKRKKTIDKGAEGVELSEEEMRWILYMMKERKSETDSDDSFATFEIIEGEEEEGEPVEDLIVQEETEAAEESKIEEQTDETEKVEGKKKKKKKKKKKGEAKADDTVESPSSPETEEPVTVIPKTKKKKRVSC